jgi:hypothetical protein
MYTSLFDTSAVVHVYLPEGNRGRKQKRIIEHILEQRTTFHKATLYIPSFCIAEVFNTFARKRFRPKENESALSAEEYKRCLDHFRQDIIWERRLYSYDLSRNHILAVDEIIPIEHQLRRRDESDHLTTLDILVIAMACELGYVGDPEKVFLVTCDRRMKDVFEELKRTDERKRKRLKVERVVIGEPEERRWIAPKVILLQEARASDIPHLERQPRLNV